MSTKLFFQIVLLIIIAAVIMTVTKCALRQICKKGFSLRCPMATEAIK